MIDGKDLSGLFSRCPECGFYPCKCREITAKLIEDKRIDGIVNSFLRWSFSRGVITPVIQELVRSGTLKPIVAEAVRFGETRARFVSGEVFATPVDSSSERVLPDMSDGEPVERELPYDGRWAMLEVRVEE